MGFATNAGLDDRAALAGRIERRPEERVRLGRFCYHRGVPVEHQPFNERLLAAGKPRRHSGSCRRNEEPPMRLLDHMQRHLRQRPHRVLSEVQRDGWDRDGYLVLEQAIPESLMQAYAEDVPRGRCERWGPHAAYLSRDHQPVARA